MYRFLSTLSCLLLVGAGCAPGGLQSTGASSQSKAAARGIVPCEAERQRDSSLPDAKTLAAVGFQSLIDDGYSPVSVCSQAMTDHVFAIFAKEELTVPEGGTEPSCVDACDVDVIAVTDLQTSDVRRFELAEPLGVYAEAHDQHCIIDGMVMTGLRTPTELHFYCGSGESGGMTAWYAFGLDTGRLTPVQTLLTIGPETFTVLDAEKLSAFRYKSNAEIPQ